jgi:CRP/FNR family cyclic AMP-dependent transcriptional regulator
METPMAPEKSKVISRFLENCIISTYSTKQLIIREGDPSKDLYYIINGSVTVVIEDTKGNEIVLAYLNPGEFFGEIGMFGDENSRTASVRAKPKSEIASISYEKLQNLTEIFPDLIFLIASQLAIRLRRTSRKVSDLAFTDVKGRVAKTLLDLCSNPDAITHPDGMQISITRQELGRIVGCSREMVGRVLKSLEEDLLISVSGKTMVIFGKREK